MLKLYSMRTRKRLQLCSSSISYTSVNGSSAWAAERGRVLLEQCELLVQNSRKVGKQLVARKATVEKAVQKALDLITKERQLLKDDVIECVQFWDPDVDVEYLKDDAGDQQAIMDKVLNNQISAEERLARKEASAAAAGPQIDCAHERRERTHVRRTAAARRGSLA